MNEPTRLLMVSRTRLDSEAGLDLLPILRAARRRGWELLAAVPTGPLAAHLDAEGIRQIRLPKPGSRLRPSAVGHAIVGGSLLIASERIARAAIGADVVLTDSLFALPVLRAGNSRLPAVLLARAAIKRPSQLALLRACASIVPMALAPSESVAGPLRAQGLAVQVIPRDLSPHRHPADTGIPRLLTIGVVDPPSSPEKQDLLLKAIANLPDREVLVELAGDGSSGTSPVETLKRRAATSGLAGRVRFLASLDDPVERMHRWTLAILPDPRSGKMRAAAREAARLGIPVLVISHGPDLKVLVGSGRSTPSSDPRALADSIGRLVDGDDHRDAHAAADWQWTGSDSDSQDYGAKVVEALAGIARIGRAASDQRTTVFVVPDFEPTIGGTTRQTRNQASVLMERGHSVAIVTRRLDRDWPRRQVTDGLDVHRIGPRRSTPLNEKLSVLAAAAWLGMHRRRVGLVQVIMYADYVLSSAAVGKLSSTVLVWAGLGDPTDVLGPTPNLLRDFQRRVRQSVLRRCRHVALTPSLAHELHGLGLHSVVIPVPIDRTWYRPPDATERLEARTRLGLHDDRCVFVYTGHLRRLKAVDRLIAAFAMLAATGRPAELLVVGAGTGKKDDSEEELRAQVVEGGLQEAVRFTGAVQNVRDYLWAADAFVLPSTREGMPNSLVEAMACGLACVAPKSAAGDEVLSEQTGIVPASNEPALLLDALTWLCDHPEERRSLGRAAAMAVEAWDLEKVVDRYEQVYDSVRDRDVPPGHRILSADVDPRAEA